ncbi:MAG TPA: hypothetical protein VID03_00335 [Acidimicrobiia bacterium]
MSMVGSHGAYRAGVIPESLPGKLSVASFLVLVVGALALFAAAAIGETGGESILDNLWLGVPGIVGLAGALTSMITGLVAVIRRHDRVVSVVVAASVSTLVFVFVLLSVLFG